MNIFSRTIAYLKDSKSELRHVNWPTRKQTKNYTIIVVIMALAVAAFLGVFDFIFSKLLSIFI